MFDLIPKALHYLSIRKRIGDDGPNFIAYRYGSRVYGTESYDSDYDYIVVSEKAEDGKEEYFYSQNDQLNVHYHTPEHWQQMVDEHKIFALESIFQYDESHQYRKNFKLDLTKLRKEISEKSNHSWVKAKKKLLVEHDYKIGLKSFFHSFRIIMFGTQIAIDGHIYNYKMGHTIWEPIKALMLEINKDNVEEIYAKLIEEYKWYHNNLMTEFRKLAPK